MMMPNKLIVFLALIPLIAYAAPVALHKDMPFAAARKLLLKEKWKPIHVHAHDDYEPMGVEHELAAAHINEFDSCSIDSSSCVMRYQRGTECLTLFTIGEKIRYMKVVQWSDECPTPALQSTPQHPER